MIVIIPMSGKGKRFIDEGYTLPKPMIDVCGKPMIERVVTSLDIEGAYIFLALKKHLKKGLDKVLTNIKRGTNYLISDIVEVSRVTQGAACTVLLAKKYISDDELIIANCDQYLDFDSTNFLKEARKSDGCIMTFNSTNPHHSYARVVHGKVIEVAEKRVISDHASAGIYYFKNGKDFICGANQMIKKNIRTNKEFYICPIYNELIADGKTITNYEIDVNSKHMLGTPYELRIFLDKIENGEVML